MIALKIAHKRYKNMKALCIKQPWALAVVDGVKTIEVRSWQTDYRGELLICASAAPKNEFWSDENFDPPVIRLLHAGCVLGSVNLIDVRPMVKADEHEGGAFCDYIKGAYAWILEATGKNYRPDKVIGQLRFFNVADDKLVELKNKDRFYNYPPAQGNIKYTARCGLT